MPRYVLTIVNIFVHILTRLLLFQTTANFRHQRNHVKCAINIAFKHIALYHKLVMVRQCVAPYLEYIEYGSCQTDGRLV